MLSLSACAQPQADSTLTEAPRIEAIDKTYGQQISDAAISITHDDVRYDPAYFSIDYPDGDVPSHVGVCTDVVIRTYRMLDKDLQQLVHEDMKAHFDLYPKNWGLKRPDSNIDHRRVPNLMTFFERHGTSLPLSKKAEDYLPGDIVSWSLGGGLVHIGVVIDETSTFGKTPLIVHNIGAGQVKQDCLFDFEIIGHYRY
ncbi:UNVERIFIED_CONTAM: hypothetical protein GTU68_000121 [Idotea baltica]|nr:hypothetical protein [Idotea baltica]